MSGEFELIAAIRERVERLGPEASPGLVLGSGDDASITVRSGATATSVDALVEGVHFRIPPFTLRQVGRKALAVALSDLAAMGARAGEAYVQLGVPGDRDDDELLELAGGLAEVAAEHRVAIAGGDLTGAPALVVALTVVGGAERPEALVRRSGASAGDLVVVTGELGGAAAGLLALERPGLAAGLDPAAAAALRLRQLDPVPLLEAGAALASAGASAMIDLSDGLGADAVHLASAAAVGLEIDLERVPVQVGVVGVAEAAGVDGWDLVAGGGEDYELLATVPPSVLECARNAVAATGTNLTVIGEVSSGAEVTLRGPDAGRAPAGFEHFRPRPAPGGPA